MIYFDVISDHSHQGVPRIIRADCGTENVVTAGLQRFFRYNADDAFAAEKSFMYGTSPANQVSRRGCITLLLKFIFHDNVNVNMFREINQENNCCGRKEHSQSTPNTTIVITELLP